MAKYDFMSFGEAMVRFTPPGHDRLGQAEVLELGIAAAELNCCVNISNLSRKLLKPQMKTAYVTKLVDAWDGDYIIKHAQMHGVDMSNVVVDPYDKIGRNGRNGKCFIEVGIGPRPSYQTYDRGHSAVSRIQPGDIDWEKVLDTRWFHSTGIVTAVGEHTATEVLAALKAAKKNGATTSFDLNYRHTLWSKEAAQAAMVGADALHRRHHRQRGGLRDHVGHQGRQHRRELLQDRPHVLQEGGREGHGEVSQRPGGGQLPA